MDNLKNKILDAHSNGRLNDYMRDRLMKSVDFGVDEQLLDDALYDAEDASKLGVGSDKDYAIRFCILTLGDDILQDTFDRKIDDDERNGLVKYILENQDERHLKDLVGLRILIYKWLCDKHEKKAYPNTGGVDYRMPTYDTNKWAMIAKKMYMRMKTQGMDREQALKEATKDWDSDEAFKFDKWLNYYESGNTEKYNVKTAQTKQALFPSMFDTSETPRSNVSPSFMSAYKAREKQQRQEERQRKREEQQKIERQEYIKRTKRQMKSRLKSLWNLVHRFNDLLPKSNVDNILSLIHYLDVNIGKLQTEASIRDVMVRTAHQIRKEGLDEGADFLVEAADEPIMEQAVESIDTDPQRPNVQLHSVVSRLEVISKMLKSRDIIRSLASVDILLNELGIASLTPELGDTQAKLNDAFSYASNKVDGVISKLRGAGQMVKPLQVGDGLPKQSTPQPAPTPPPTPQKLTKEPTEKLQTEELKEAPVENVKTELPRG